MSTKESRIGAVAFWVASFWTVGCFAQMSTDMDSQVEKLLAKMTLEEKVGQMTQLTLEAISREKESADSRHQLDQAKLKQAVVQYHVGSFLNVWDASFSLQHWHQVISAIQRVAVEQTRLGIPVVYGIDAVHGHHFLKSATVFPHNLALAATWDPVHARESNAATAWEVRASGIPWNFSPVLDVARNPLWSRFFETYGEDPFLVSAMGLAAIEGQQGAGVVLKADKVAACAKHFLGYSFPVSGKDRTPAWIPERMLREIFLPPFQAAVDAGVMTVMINSGDINGIPVHASHALLTGLLRDELGFEGVAVTDWEDVIKLHKVHRVAASEKEAVRMAVMAGIDMSMTPYTLSFHDILVQLVEEGKIPESRIDLSVRRILKLKFRLGLFENPYPQPTMAQSVGGEKFRNISLRAAQDAITLLKNDNGRLPLSKSANLLVTGPGATSLPALHGAWTYTWQGNDESLFPAGTRNLLEALKLKADSGTIHYVPGTTFAEEVDIEAAVEAARQADIVIVAVAEKPSVEQMGIIEDLNLPEVQLRLAKAVQSTGTPVVLVLIENRPRIVRTIEPGSESILMAYHPGSQGADAIADVIYGDINPSGKLPFTYPRHSGSLELYDHRVSERQELAYAWKAFNPQWTFGHGLSYTTFEYSDMHLDKTEMRPDDVLTVSVTVKNIGQRSGKEVVKLYVSDLFASVTPAVKRLKGFSKINLNPGESKTVSFGLDRQKLSFIGPGNQPIVEAGDFEVYAGNLKSRFSVK